MFEFFSLFSPKTNWLQRPGSALRGVILAGILFAPMVAQAQVGTPDPGFGTGVCGGTVAGFSPTFFGNWFDPNFPPAGCQDSEILGNLTQKHSFGRGAGLQDFTGVKRLIVGGWVEFNPTSGAGPWQQFALSAYDGAGDLDPTFGGGDGKVMAPFTTTAKAYDVLVRDDNTIILAGSESSGVMAITGHDIDGTLLWQQVTPVVASQGARAIAPLDTTPMSDFFLIGSDASSGFSEIVLARFDSNGAFLSQASFGNTLFGTVGMEFFGLDIAVDAMNGYLYLAGIVRDPTGPSKHMILIRTDLAGIPVKWTPSGGGFGIVPFDGVVTTQVTVAGTPRDSEARAVTISPNGDIYLGGKVEVGIFSRMAAVRVVASGPLAGWRLTASTGPVDSLANAILIDSRQRVVLAGEAQGTPPQTPVYALARLDQHLTPDISFGLSGVGWHSAPGSAGPSRGFDVVREADNGNLWLAGDTVIDSGSIPPYVTNWTQTGSRWEGGPVCGNGILEGTEDCEAPFGACCTVTCDFKPSAEVCRGSAGACDIQETCTGTSDTCPADTVESAATVCRASGGVCDIEETCDGANVTCPADAVESAATVCRAFGGVCDIEETCDGTGVTCPADAVESAATICRASGGVCDIAETCDGTGVTCPADAVESAATVCRASGGVCDVEETCDGSSVTCPADAFESAATVCRASGGVCDLAETCDGASANCPTDAFESAATVCRVSGGVCDLAETCDGASANCPTDAFESAATVCRASGGVCDIAETCDGTSAGCPTDAVEPSTTVCRPSVDLCDAEETCDGSGVACPADGVEAAGTICRPGVDECDADEECDGTASNCPADAFEPAGTPAPTLCDDGEACTADVCDGAGGCDNSGAVSSAGFDYNEDGTVDASDDVDTDTDGIIDACDNCISDCNPDQLDTDEDCTGSAPWSSSLAPECGDVCDVCPASDEVAMASDPNCATFDYNSAKDCCEETGEGVSVDASGESCGGAAGDTDFSATGATTSAAVRIPAGAVTEDTSFSADSKTKGGDEFFVRGGSGTYVGGWDFGPEGVTFGVPVVVCMTWNDPDNDGKLEKSEGYDYQITEATIAPYHIDSVGGEYKLADKCSLVPCTSFDAAGFPDNWGGYTRYDETSTPTVDESTLGACCGATENRYCFEVYHFSTYALADPNCSSEALDRTKLRVLKIDKELGEQKVVFSTEIRVPVEASGDPDPAIDPVSNGFSISLLDSDDLSPILWSAKVDGGAYDSSLKVGWKTNGAGTTWIYKGRNHPDGILKVVVKSLAKKEPGLFKVKVVAKDATVQVLTSPVQAEISLDPSGFLDRCAMSSYQEPPADSFCVTNAKGSALICR